MYVNGLLKNNIKDKLILSYQQYKFCFIKYLYQWPFCKTFCSDFAQFHMLTICTQYLRSYLITIIAPRSKLQEASLLVKWEVSNIDFTGRFEDGWRGPQDLPGVMQNCFSHRCHYVFAVSTRRKEIDYRYSSFTWTKSYAILGNFYHDISHYWT